MTTFLTADTLSFISGSIIPLRFYYPVNIFMLFLDRITKITGSLCRTQSSCQPHFCAFLCSASSWPPPVSSVTDATFTQQLRLLSFHFRTVIRRCAVPFSWIMSLSQFLLKCTSINKKVLKAKMVSRLRGEWVWGSKSVQKQQRCKQVSKK